MTANDHDWLQPTRFRYATSALPKELGAATVLTVPWNLMSRLASNPHQHLTPFCHGPVVVRRFPSTLDTLRLPRFGDPKASDDLPAPGMPSRTSRTVENAHPSRSPEGSRGFLAP